MSKDKSGKENAKLECFIEHVLQEQSVLGNNAAADAFKPLVNLISGLSPQADAESDDDD
jgi:hypothetical protein